MQKIQKRPICLFFFFNDTATTEIYTLSLHDALPIYPPPRPRARRRAAGDVLRRLRVLDAGHLSAAASRADHEDRKSTRLNSSHSQISYAVFCLKKKKAASDLERIVERIAYSFADGI